MKANKLFTILLSLFFVTAISGNAFAQKKKQSFDKKDCVVKFTVKSEKGDVNYAKLTRALKEIEGVKSVKTIASTGAVEIECSGDKSCSSNLKTVVSDLGYTAEFPNFNDKKSGYSKAGYSKTAKKRCSKSKVQGCSHSKAGRR